VIFEKAQTLPDGGIVYANSFFTVIVRDVVSQAGMPAMRHLSIRRDDRQPIHDWRSLQEIKNSLLGNECEAVEIYPAESRLVDMANQYHLWAFADTGLRFPFGFDTRAICDDAQPIRGAVQRPREIESQEVLS